MGDSNQKQSTKLNQDKSGKDKKKTKPWHHRNQPTESKRKDPEAIPVLKYGPSNNFQRRSLEDGFKGVWSNREIDQTREARDA